MHQQRSILLEVRGVCPIPLVTLSHEESEASVRDIKSTTVILQTGLECAGISKCPNWWARTKVAEGGSDASSAILPAEARPGQTLVLALSDLDLWTTGPGEGLAFFLSLFSLPWVHTDHNPPTEERDGFGNTISSFRNHCYSFLGSVSAAACPTHVSSLAFKVSEDLKGVLFQVSLVELSSTSLSPFDSWIILDYFISALQSSHGTLQMSDCAFR